MFDPTTPKGFYFNRGVYYFGNMVDAEIHGAEQKSRKGRKPGEGTDALANAARLSVLEKYLGVPVKRHRTPELGGSGAHGQITDSPGKQKEERIIIKVD